MYTTTSVNVAYFKIYCKIIITKSCINIFSCGSNFALLFPLRQTVFWSEDHRAGTNPCGFPSVIHHFFSEWNRQPTIFRLDKTHYWCALGRIPRTNPGVTLYESVRKTKTTLNFEFHVEEKRKTAGNSIASLIDSQKCVSNRVSLSGSFCLNNKYTTAPGKSSGYRWLLSGNMWYVHTDKVKNSANVKIDVDGITVTFHLFSWKRKSSWATIETVSVTELCVSAQKQLVVLRRCGS